MKAKKLIAILLTVLTVFSLSACSGTETRMVSANPQANAGTEAAPKSDIVAEATGSDLRQIALPEATSSDLVETLLYPTEVSDVSGVRFSVPTCFETADTTTYSAILRATLNAAVSGGEEDIALVNELSSLPFRLSYNEGYLYIDTQYGLTMITVSKYENAPENLSELTEDDFVRAFTTCAVNESEAGNVEFASFAGRNSGKASAVLIYNYGSGDAAAPVRGIVSIIRSEANGNAFVMAAFDSSSFFSPDSVAETFVIDDTNPGCGVVPAN